MNILGIETSCDETACSIVKDGRFILSYVVASSLKEHKKFGGIIPEIASRRQIEYITPVVKEALREAHLKLHDIDAIAFTASPGLIGSLLVGISFARALGYALAIPLIEVDHIQAHLYANFLTASQKKSDFYQQIPQLPVIGLVVSGGHTSLFHIKGFTHFRLLGQTRDDAAGEAFDKVARILNLGYPGGPVIDRLSRKVRQNKLKFTCADLPGSLDFSFSGIKTAILYHARSHQNEKDFSVEQVAHAFQKSVVSVLVKKSLLACQKEGVKTLVVGGGVAANSALRDQLMSEAKKEGIKVFFPHFKLCLDNASMIAGLAFHLHPQLKNK